MPRLMGAGFVAEDGGIEPLERARLTLRSAVL